MNETYKARLGLLPTLAEQAPAGHIGRTALMKYMYFLQTLRKVPLGYNFSLYSYGPFDSDVLADLSSAQALNIVNVTPVEFPGGYGYRIQPGNRAESAKRSADEFLRKYAGDIAWLFSVFGDFNSANLELASTAVYVDRELARSGEHRSIQDITSRVHEIKPHFNKQYVRKVVTDLTKKGVLSSPPHGHASRSA